jgi:hypothetical protein
MTENWIRVYDNVIAPEVCDDLVDFFERNPEHHEMVRLEGHRQFAQVNLQMHEEWNGFSDVLTEKFKEYIEVYCDDCNVTNMMFPQQFAFEMYRMKRYLPNGIDEFHDHVDVGNLDSARRFLVFFLYLNEPEGGTTDFPQYNISVKPKKGSMLMFPPLWTHLHAGRKPINLPKYIIGSYLHYV